MSSFLFKTIAIALLAQNQVNGDNTYEPRTVVAAGLELGLASIGPAAAHAVEGSIGPAFQAGPITSDYVNHHGYQAMDSNGHLAPATIDLNRVPYERPVVVPLKNGIRLKMKRKPRALSAA